jgi:hypothetical protein
VHVQGEVANGFAVMSGTLDRFSIYFARSFLRNSASPSSYRCSAEAHLLRVRLLSQMFC